VTLAVGFLELPLGVAIVMSAAAIFYLVVGTIGVRRLWRRESAIWDSKPVWFLYGHTTFRGYVRAMYPLGTAGLVAFAWLLYAIWGPEDVYAQAFVLVPMLALVAVGLLLALTAALFNRPKRIVPPHLRDQPGMIAEWVEKARAKRAARMPDEPPPQRSA
jgi:hypothetical protein